MAQRSFCRQTSSPYFLPCSRGEIVCSRGRPGPVFANERHSGWIRLNAARACARCRARHVKCSLITTGGPCTHCRKRKEVCEVLGWKIEPQSVPRLIYKLILPPPTNPIFTPAHEGFDRLALHLGSPIHVPNTRDDLEGLDQISFGNLHLTKPQEPNEMITSFICSSENQKLLASWTEKSSGQIPRINDDQNNSYFSATLTPLFAAPFSSRAPREFDVQLNLNQALPCFDSNLDPSCISSPSEQSDSNCSAYTYQDSSPSSINLSFGGSKTSTKKFNRMSLNFIMDSEDSASLIKFNDKKDLEGVDSPFRLDLLKSSSDQLQRPTLPSVRELTKFQTRS